MIKIERSVCALATVSGLVGCMAEPDEDALLRQARQRTYVETTSSTTSTTSGTGGCDEGSGGNSSSSSISGGTCPVVVVEDLSACIAPGSPRTECGDLGLVVLGKDDDLSGLSFTATTDAYVAIVASGRGACGRHTRSASIYVDVSEGDVLHPPGGQGISHVTYCACPEDVQEEAPL